MPEFDPAKDYNKDDKVSKKEEARFRRENPDDLIASKWGFAYAVIASDTELLEFFNKKAAEYLKNPSGFSDAAFYLELSEQDFSQRYRASALEDMNFEARYGDQYNLEIDSEVEDLRDETLALGASLSDVQLRELAVRKRRTSMSGSQVSNFLSEYISVKDGRFTGAAGITQDTINKWAMSNGLSLSSNSVQDYVKSIARGDSSFEDIKSDLRRTYMAGAYPAWSDRINAGQDISDIAAPYKSRMAKLLEIDESQIDFNDNMLSQGLQGVGADGKAGIVPLYEFDKMIRKDPRWDRTENALKTYTDAGSSILKMFGLR
jgi:hypothetical protein